MRSASAVRSALVARRRSAGCASRRRVAAAGVSACESSAFAVPTAPQYIVGTIRTCFPDRRGVPRQPILCPATRGRIKLSKQLSSTAAASIATIKPLKYYRYFCSLLYIPRRMIDTIHNRYHSLDLPTQELEVVLCCNDIGCESCRSFRLVRLAACCSTFLSYCYPGNCSVLLPFFDIFCESR